MIVYLDTSAYVKLILDETGSPQVREWFTEARGAASSVITYPEASAALGRRSREEGAPPSSLAGWVATLDERWRSTAAVPATGQPAGRLALAYGLRGMDAIQLAAAVTLRERVRTESPVTEFVFATFDLQLLDAAEREGFATLGGPLG